MEDGGRTLKTDLEKTTAFNRSHATVSRQVGNSKVDCDVKARLKAPNARICHECQGNRTSCCAPFTTDGRAGATDLERAAPEFTRPRQHLQRASEAPGPPCMSDAPGPDKRVVADWSCLERVAPRNYRPHPQSGQRPEEDPQLPPNRLKFPHHQNRRTRGRRPPGPPHCDAEAHPTGASQIQGGARSGGRAGMTDPAGAGWLEEEAVPTIPEESDSEWRVSPEIRDGPLRLCMTRQITVF